MWQTILTILLLLLASKNTSINSLYTSPKTSFTLNHRFKKKEKKENPHQYLHKYIASNKTQLPNNMWNNSEEFAKLNFCVDRTRTSIDIMNVITARVRSYESTSMACAAFALARGVGFAALIFFAFLDPTLNPWLNLFFLMPDFFLSTCHTNPTPPPLDVNE